MPCVSLTKWSSTFRTSDLLRLALGSDVLCKLCSQQPVEADEENAVTGMGEAPCGVDRKDRFAGARPTLDNGAGFGIEGVHDVSLLGGQLIELLSDAVENEVRWWDEIEIGAEVGRELFDDVGLE